MEQPSSNIDSRAVTYIVSDAQQGIRLDHFLVHKLSGSSRSRIVSAVKHGLIVVNGAAVKAGCRLKGGDVISGQLDDAERSDGAGPEPQPIDFTVLHEDESLLVIDKPPHLVVHPGSGNRDRTLINGLLHRFSELAGVGDSERPGIVHRLDKDTSGVLVVARTAGVHRDLVRAFKERLVHKTYLALVHGIVDGRQGVVESPIGRHPIHRQKMAIRPVDGRPALTRWQVRRVFERLSLLEVVIETGRTHQIRVHLASIGHPVAGDRLYGANRPNEPFPRQMLHAWKLRLNHPVTGRSLAFEAALPDDFAELLRALEEG